MPRPSQSEEAILLAHFAKDPHWSKQTVAAVMAKVKMSRRKVYKWGYDKKHKALEKELVTNHVKVEGKISVRIRLEYAKHAPVSQGALDFNQLVHDILVMSGYEAPSSKSVGCNDGSCEEQISLFDDVSEIEYDRNSKQSEIYENDGDNFEEIFDEIEPLPLSAIDLLKDSSDYCYFSNQFRDLKFMDC